MGSAQKSTKPAMRFHGRNMAIDMQRPAWVQHLVDRRLSLGMSQGALAATLDVEEKIVSAWERLELPKAFMIQCWHSALGINLTLDECKALRVQAREAKTLNEPRTGA